MSDLVIASQSLSETSNESRGNVEQVNKEPQIQQQEASLVSYDTHKRLLSEKKKLEERLNSLETQWKSKHEAELKSQNQYKELYENTLKEKETYASRFQEQEQKWNNAVKLDSFMQAMGARKIEPKYASFINLESIALDSDTGSVDSLSVQREVDRICREFPEIIKGAVQPKQLPTDAPRNPYSQVDSLKNLSSKDKIKQAAMFLSQNR